MNTLNLSEFVSNTIVEIAKGVEQAKIDLKEYDVLINPATDSEGKVKTNSTNYVRLVQDVEFDLSVTINQDEKQTEESDKSGASKIQVVSIINFSLGGSMSNKKSEEIQNSHSAINRIKFIVPVSFSTNSEGTKVKSGISLSSVSI